MSDQNQSTRGFEREHDDSSESSKHNSTLPPPVAHREDTVVRATTAEARRELSNIGEHNQHSFTKGDNAPTFNESGLPYTIEDMDAQRYGTPPESFGDTPGGAGATPLSAERDLFIDHVMRQGHFPSRQEATTWTRAVFNALRQHAIENDPAITSELAPVIRVGEAPEVQVEEMMWGGDYATRMMKLLVASSDWSKEDLCREVAKEGNSTAEDPWVEAAIYSFFDALKLATKDSAHPISSLGQLQEIWDRAG